MRTLETCVSYFSKTGDMVDLPPVDGFAKMVLGYLSNEVPSRETKSKVKLSGRALATTAVGAAEQTVASAAARMEIVVDFIFGVEWLCWWLMMRWWMEMEIGMESIGVGPYTFIHQMPPCY